MFGNSPISKAAASLAQSVSEIFKRNRPQGSEEFLVDATFVEKLFLHHSDAKEAHEVFAEMRAKTMTMVRAVLAVQGIKEDQRFPHIVTDRVKFTEVANFFGQRALCFKIEGRTWESEISGFCLGDGKVYTNDCLKLPNSLAAYVPDFLDMILWTKRHAAPDSIRSKFISGDYFGGDIDTQGNIFYSSNIYEYDKLCLYMPTGESEKLGRKRANVYAFAVKSRNQAGPFTLSNPAANVNEAIARMLSYYVRKMTTDEVKRLTEMLSRAASAPGQQGRQDSEVGSTARDRLVANGMVAALPKPVK